MVCRDCLGRTPFGSLIATFVTLIGVAVFCATLYRALDITLRGIFENLFNFPIPWLESIQIGFIVIAVVMGLYAIILLVFGFLATGATRQNIYSGAKCIMGGRLSAGFFMLLTYALNIIWMCVTSMCAIPIVIYVMLRSICHWEIEDREIWYYENYCFNLSRFGIYTNLKPLSLYIEDPGSIKNAICEDHELAELCQHVADAGPMYGLAFGSSLIIVLALSVFLVALAANYSRIMTTKELTEYKQAIALDGPMDAHPGVCFLISMATNYQKIKMSKELTDYRGAVDLELSDAATIVSSNIISSNSNSKIAY